MEGKKHGHQFDQHIAKMIRHRPELVERARTLVLAPPQMNAIITSIFVPKGSEEAELKYPMEWVRRHDPY